MPFGAQAQQQSHDSRRGAPMVVFWTGLILLLYILSTGPVVKLGASRQFVLTLYAPLVYVSDKVRSVDSFFSWYINDLWKAELK